MDDSACETFQCIAEKPSTAVTLKCSAEWLRRFYEPVPFCIRWAAYLSAFIGLVSTVLGVQHMRRDLYEIRRLVEEHYEVGVGFPLDPTVRYHSWTHSLLAAGSFYL